MLGDMVTWGRCGGHEGTRGHIGGCRDMGKMWGDVGDVTWGDVGDVTCRGT